MTQAAHGNDCRVPPTAAHSSAHDVVELERHTPFRAEGTPVLPIVVDSVSKQVYKLAEVGEQKLALHGGGGGAGGGKNVKADPLGDPWQQPARLRTYAISEQLYWPVD